MHLRSDPLALTKPKHIKRIKTTFFENMKAVCFAFLLFLKFPLKVIMVKGNLTPKCLPEFAGEL